MASQNAPCRAVTVALGLAAFLGCAASGLDAPPPLGSLENPVRAHTFLGEFEYLSRLRCPDGSKPHTQRLHHRPRGPYGNKLIGWRVRCIYSNAESRVFLDAFHPDHVETEPVPGFAIAGDPDPRRLFWMQR